MILCPMSNVAARIIYKNRKEDLFFNGGYGLLTDGHIKIIIAAYRKVYMANIREDR